MNNEQLISRNIEVKVEIPASVVKEKFDSFPSTKQIAEDDYEEALNNFSYVKYLDYIFDDFVERTERLSNINLQVEPTGVVVDKDTMGEDGCHEIKSYTYRVLISFIIPMALPTDKKEAILKVRQRLFEKFAAEGLKPTSF